MLSRRPARRRKTSAACFKLDRPPTPSVAASIGKTTIPARTAYGLYLWQSEASARISPSTRFTFFVNRFVRSSRKLIVLTDTDKQTGLLRRVTDVQLLEPFGSLNLPFVPATSRIRVDSRQFRTQCVRRFLSQGGRKALSEISLRLSTDLDEIPVVIRKLRRSKSFSDLEADLIDLLSVSGMAKFDLEPVDVVGSRGLLGRPRHGASLLDRDQRSEPTRQHPFAPQLAFPYYQYFESTVSQQLRLRCVADAIRCEFSDPEITVSLRYGRFAAIPVMMPEAPVDEDRPPSALVGEIRGTGQVARRTPVVQAQLTQDRADGLLWRRPRPPDALHQGATLRICRQFRPCHGHSAAIGITRSRVRTCSRWRRRRSRKPSTNLRLLFSVRERKPAVARADKRSAG